MHLVVNWVQDFFVERETMLEKLKQMQEVCWRNDGRKPMAQIGDQALTLADVKDAEARLARFAPYFMAAFPQTVASKGIVESELRAIPAMQQLLERENGVQLAPVLLKMDSHLPISGSIKARGGIYEVLKTAEDIALASGMLKKTDDYSILNTPPFRKLFSSYAIAVGSTGNLGLSIGIASAKLGFRVTVHMSADARQWKKDLLRSHGVTVVEYESDYSEAVKQGRKLAEQDPMCHFVDDENSKTLFLGYSVAALRLQKQLVEMGIAVDAQHPLNVYLPCGVGGGPGGVAFGLRLVYGDAVRCFFAEPTGAPCMILGMSTGLHDGISCGDIGISGATCADGLAVGRASGFVGKFMEPHMAGCYTITDERMYKLLAQLANSEGIFLEPSALAGMYGPVVAQTDGAFAPFSDAATHIVWATGGSMVPPAEMEKYYALGK